MLKVKYYLEALYRSYWHGRNKYKIGRHSYGRPRVVRYGGDESAVNIGKYCSIAKNVTIFAGGNHRTDWVSTYPFRIMFHLAGRYEDGHPASKGDVHIGNDVWLGYGATILSGVRIGDGAVVAARAVVVKNVPPYAIAGGNPAKILGYRFAEEKIEALLAIRWWDWPEQKVLAAVDLLNSENIDHFLERFGK